MVQLLDSMPGPGNGKGMLENVEAKSIGGYEFHSFRESAKAHMFEEKYHDQFLMFTYPLD